MSGICKKGKTYEELYGKEKAKKIKKEIGRKNRNKTYEEIYGKKKAVQIKSKISKNWKGKTYKEIHGEEKAKILLANRTGKTYKELYGKEKAKYIISKISKKKKGVSWEKRHGKEKAKERKLKLSQKTKIWTKEKIIINLTEIIKKTGPIKRSDVPNLCHYYNICCGDTIRRTFGSLDNLAIETNIEFKLPPNKAGMGTNEKQILDEIEKEKNITLLRQFSIAGRFIDGYDRENNIAYEVDEWQHKYKRIEDTLRENQIKEVLNCEFIRIPG